MRPVRPPFFVPYALLSLLLLLLVLSDCGQQPASKAASVLSQTPMSVAHKSTVRSGSQAVSKESEALPVRLMIPAIGVNAAVERVEVSADGNLSTPTIHPWDDTGWYDPGVRPGEQGSAVIDGHLDRPGGFPAVFWNLRKLHSGDQVNVAESSGKTLHFRVLQVAFYTPQNAPIQSIFGNDSGKYLNLITCAGDWIPSQHQTTLRLVIYTQLIG